MNFATTSTPTRRTLKRAVEDAFPSPSFASSCGMKRARPDYSVDASSSDSTTSRPQMSISFLLNDPVEVDQAADSTPSPAQLLSSCGDLLYFAESRAPIRSTTPMSSKSCSIEDASSEVSEEGRPRSPVSPIAAVSPASSRSPSRNAEAPVAPTVARTVVPTVASTAARTPAKPQSPFECDLCHKRFRERGNLTKHRNSVHSSAPRPFVCGVAGCGKSFSFRDGLNRHTQTVHDCVRPYACSVKGCEKRFKQRSHALKHVKTCHREEA